MENHLQFVTDLCWISRGYFADWQWQSLRMQVTFHPVTFGDPPKPPVCLMQESECGQFIGLPVFFALKTFQTLIPSGQDNTLAGAWAWFGNGTTKGEPMDVEYPRKRPMPRGQKQETFFNDLTFEARQRPVLLAEAPTGSGKTVAGLSTCFDLGRTSLIIVPKKRIAKQWRECLVDLFGMDAHEIGIVEEGVFDFEGKPITIAVIHNLVNKPVSELPPGFLDYFGTVVWDEAHNLGAERFSQTMPMIRAANRIALTATPERGDKMEGVFLSYFGEAGVKHTGTALAARARVFDYEWDFADKLAKAQFNAKPRAIILKILTKSHRRNMFVSGHVVRLANAGRQVLVISDRVDQLLALMAMCMAQGLDESSLGLYARQYTNEEGKKKTVKDSDLDYVAENCQIIFATYGMAREGLDIPRLDAGVDASPSSKGTQVIGRIRRPLPGKPLPLWVTFRDIGLDTFENACRLRLRDYRKTSVEVIDHGQEKAA